MSMDNKTENDILKMLLEGTDPSYRGDLSQYLALITGAAPSEADPMVNECTYTGYIRVEIVKATGWTDGGSSFTNKAQIEFGARSDAGAVQTATYFAVVDSSSGTIDFCVVGELSTPLAITQNIQPIFAIGDLEVTAD
jgi:hypothetical protein